MKNPLRSARVDLVVDGVELRVTFDGLTKGFLRKQLPGEGGGWFWRQIDHYENHSESQIEPRTLVHGDYGEAPTKHLAVCRTLGGVASAGETRAPGKGAA